MRNLIKYYYDQAKKIGVQKSPTKELIDLGFRGILINEMHLPEFILYETKNKVDKLPFYIEYCRPGK